MACSILTGSKFNDKIFEVIKSGISSSTEISEHTHEISDITDLQETLDEKCSISSLQELILKITGVQSALDEKADKEHTHTMSDITDLTTSETNVSKTDSEGNYVPFMKLTADQINTFEGIATIHIETLQGTTIEYKILLKILAYGDFIIDPILCTVEITEDTKELYTMLWKCTHNESGDIVLALTTNNSDSYSPTLRQLTIEGTTNSPTDYEVLNYDEITLSTLKDSSKYASSINYPTFSDDDIVIYSKLGFSE